MQLALSLAPDQQIQVQPQKGVAAKHDDKKHAVVEPKIHNAGHALAEQPSLADVRQRVVNNLHLGQHANWVDGNEHGVSGRTMRA